jgi:flagellar hook-associated protein 2
MAAINVPGLGSGLDIAGMSSGLAQAEMGGFIKEAQRQQYDTSSQISSLSKITSALGRFQGTLNGMNIGSMSTNTLTYASPDKVVDITATGRAVNGNYDVEVISIASSHRLKSQSFSDTQYFHGNLSISTPDSNFHLTVPEGSSIFALANQINNEAEGIAAVVIDNGSGNVLSISSELTGTDGLIEIIGTDDSSSVASELNKLTFTSTTQSMTEVKQASDAIIKINGVQIISSDNNFDDAISGLEISINNSIAVDKIGDVQGFTISKDSSAIKTKVNQFVSDYNSIISGLKALSKYDPETDSAGVFTGDSDIRILQSKLSTAMTSPIEDAMGRYTTLYSIGVRTTDDGTFSIDDEILATAVADDEASVLSLLATGLSSNHPGVSVLTDMSDEVEVFSETITVTSHPTPAYAASTSFLSTDPSTTPVSILSGINLNFNGLLLASALGEGGDDLDFTNYNDLIAQINADLLEQNIPVSATLDIHTDPNSPLFLSTIKFTQDTTTEGLLELDSLGTLADMGFNPASPVPTKLGTLDYKSQEYDFVNSFTMPDENIDLDLNPDSINIPEQITITASKGFAFRINELMNNYIDGPESILETKDVALRDSNDRLSTRIEELEDKKDRVESRYLKQFQALDIALVRMKQKSEALTGQLDSIQSLTDSINNR